MGKLILIVSRVIASGVNFTLVVLTQFRDGPTGMQPHQGDIREPS